MRMMQVHLGLLVVGIVHSRSANPGVDVFRGRRSSVVVAPTDKVFIVAYGNFLQIFYEMQKLVKQVKKISVISQI